MSTHHGFEAEENRFIEEHLPTHELHFYDVQRLMIEANETIEIDRSTDNRFHLCMLVEGDAIEVQYNLVEQRIKRNKRDGTIISRLFSFRRVSSGIDFDRLSKTINGEKKSASSTFS